MGDRSLKPLLATMVAVSPWGAGATPGLAQGQAADAAPALTPGTSFTIRFLDMPPMLFDLWNRQNVPAQMTVFLPHNYDLEREHPLRVFLNGGDGGDAGNPGVARGLTEELDFVCVAMPLFRQVLDASAPANIRSIIVQGADGEFAWPLYKRMLKRLEGVVPNVDPTHRILRGFSNGAHATAAPIDGSDGDATQQFSGFLLTERGGKLQHCERLTGKPFLMLSSNSKSLP